MDKKKLAIELSKLRVLDNLDVNLEQYQTEGNFAADLLWLAYQNGDIKNKIVADLGCGNGIFGIGALILGAKFVYFLDLDEKSLDICKENVGFGNCEFILGDVSRFSEKVDVVIMNPPFGVQKRKADKVFLEVAMKISKKIYSIHKLESENFISKLTKENGFSVLDIIRKEFIIKKIHEFHKKNRYSFDVGVWILERNV